MWQALHGTTGGTARSRYLRRSAEVRK
jgi:hypothetical protein